LQEKNFEDAILWFQAIVSKPAPPPTNMGKDKTIKGDSSIPMDRKVSQGCDQMLAMYK
jgi:hypothetical protein